MLSLALPARLATSSMAERASLLALRSDSTRTLSRESVNRALIQTASYALLLIRTPAPAAMPVVATTSLVLVVLTAPFLMSSVLQIAFLAL